MDLVASLLPLALACVKAGLFWMSTYLIFSWIYHALEIHRKYGIFRAPEPQVHFRTLLLNWKVPFLWGIGITLMRTMMGMKIGAELDVVFELPEEFVVLRSPNLWTDLLYALVGFYLIDFFDYWMHRLHHTYNIFYSKFPFGHFVHHNCVYLNPMAVQSSPLVHLTAISGFGMYTLYLSQNLLLPLLIIHTFKIFSNYTSHLGCDPLPWLTRLNHRVGGWIPWIPVHHQYHHLPYVKDGNYGNFTCLWDYVFGTVIPESIYHIENGKPLARVQDRMDRGDEVMGKFLKGKTAFNL